MVFITRVRVGQGGSGSGSALEVIWVGYIGLEEKTTTTCVTIETSIKNRRCRQIFLNLFVGRKQPVKAGCLGKGWPTLSHPAE